MGKTIKQHKWLYALDILSILIAYFFSIFLDNSLEKRLVIFILAGGSLLISIHFMAYLFIRDRKRQADSRLGKQIALICDALFTFILFSFQSVKLPGYLETFWTVSYLICIGSFFIAIYLLFRLLDNLLV